MALGAAAELDSANILKCTAEHFGPGRAHAYRNTIVRAIGEIAHGPDVAGSRARDEILRGLRTLQRILHDGMDLPRHLPFADDERDE